MLRGENRQIFLKLQDIMSRTWSCVYGNKNVNKWVKNILDKNHRSNEPNVEKLPRILLMIKRENMKREVET